MPFLMKKLDTLFVSVNFNEERKHNKTRKEYLIAEGKRTERMFVR